MTTLDQQGVAHDDADLKTTTQSEPEMRFESSDEGTFLFPPASYASVVAYANFWARVPISDGVLSNITAGYADLIRRQKIAESTVWGQRYDDAHDQELHHGTDSARAAARDRRSKAYDDYMQKWHETYPEKIKAGSARSVARAAQAYFYSGVLVEAEREEIYSATILLSANQVTIADVADLYQLHRIRDFFQDPDVTAAERLEDIRVELRNMQRSS